MNYSKVYYDLCEKGRYRELDGYVERHHIVPRCMGGTDDRDNLVSLTPEEHYVAHQLLVKMYPDNRQLIHAAIMMIPKSKTQNRNNKMYGWLKKKYRVVCQERTGVKNSSHGRRWYHNPDTLDNGKFRDNEVPEGWVLGRVPKEEKRHCKNCGESFVVKYRSKKQFCNKKCANQIEKNDLKYDLRKEEFLNYIRFGYSITKAIKKMGYKNWRSGAGIGRWAKRLLDEVDTGS